MACAAEAQAPSSFTTGITLMGGDSCPVFIVGVGVGSPGAEAGIESGDRLTAVDGRPVANLQEAAKLLHSETARPVTLNVVRGGKSYQETVRRTRLSTLLQEQGEKILESGMIAPLDATEDEMKDKMLALKQERFVDRVFPTHYPTREKLYYPGFEILVLKNPSQLGMDVHQATISVAVMDSSGKLIMECILETKAATILEFIDGLRGPLSVAFEEGTSAAWLHDLLKPHVSHLVVCDPRRNALLKDGSKSDRIDARKLAELLHGNKLHAVYHGEHGLRALKELGAAS
jgi:hypothetical protein